MRRLLLALFCAALAACSTAPPPAPTAPGGFHRPDPIVHPDLYVWTDSCNVYVLRDGDAAILIDLGDGSVLEHLGDIGIKSVEWVLFTHHHREQCQGFPKLKGWNAKVAVPEAERDLFENPLRYRRMKVALGDPFTVHGASFVRPPIQPIPVDRAFRKMDTFSWRGRDVWCVDTRGNSPGAMSYVLRKGATSLAFSGDVMLDGAALHNWFDSEWDYGFGAGLHAITNAAGQLRGYDPEWLLPSHGPPIRNAGPMLDDYVRKLRTLERKLLRGYEVSSVAPSWQDRVSRPTSVPHLWQVSPHLYKFRGPNFYPNFCLILADSGRGLLVDCGLLDEKFLDDTIALAGERLGLKGIDAVIPTHMHGDHFLQAPHLRKKYGTKIWALDRMAEVCEHPERFDYAAPIQAYGQKFDGGTVQGVSFDRLFKDGESFEWEGFRFTVDWMPGQTEFALCVQGMIDGKKVAFTGDNLFGDPRDPNHTGHEAVVAHNSAVLEEGYILGAEYLSRLQPDLIMGGHSYVMDQPAAFIERYRRWAYEMRDAFQALSADPDYRYGFDPFWVRAAPYRSSVSVGGSVELTIHVRNFRARPQRHRLELHAAPGLIVEPALIRGELAPNSRGTFTVRVRPAADATPGVRLVALDATIDGRRYGEWFDAIVEVRP